MFIPTKPLCLLSVLLPFISILARSSSDYTTLVYKGCADKSFSDPTGVYSQALSTLFSTLVSQSIQTKFYKNTTGNGQSTINGLFQCRGDLSNNDCYNCVSQLPTLMNKVCNNNNPVASRIQLSGCYMFYEVAGFPRVSGTEMLFKSCSVKNMGGEMFEEARDTALNEVENGVSNNNSDGFYSTSYEYVYGLGQCEGDLGSTDCGDCVKNAVEKAQVECGSSVSGEIYLDKCFITYYSSNGGMPQTSSASSSFSPHTSTGSGTNSGKTAAIILGAAAGVGFIAICLAFARGLIKNHDHF